MPALWQSSQRPMYVRTVWIDGVRHAILSHDDPYLLKLNATKRRPHTSTDRVNIKSNQTHKRKSRLNHNDLENCLKKTNFVIKTIDSTESESVENTDEPDIEKLNLTDLEEETDDLLIKANSQTLYVYETSRTKLNRLSENMKNLSTNRTSRSDAKENTDLSDRVLQWLDLAGKVDLLAPDNSERMSQPRHSWPEIQRKNMSFGKLKTNFEQGNKVSSKVNTPKDTEKTQIDRTEMYVPRSSNTIEQYARQSRKTKLTPRVDTYAKTKDSTKKKPLETKTNIQETRQKIAKEINAVEKQYAELVNKKLMPELNRISKKQVHIFMPEMPKKSNSILSIRTGSLVSQKP